MADGAIEYRDEGCTHLIVENRSREKQTLKGGSVQEIIRPMERVIGDGGIGGRIGDGGISGGVVSDGGIGGCGIGGGVVSDVGIGDGGISDSNVSDGGVGDGGIDDGGVGVHERRVVHQLGADTMMDE